MFGFFYGDNMAKEDISRRVTEMLMPFLEENGLDIYKVEYKKEGPSWVLRVSLDKPADAESEYVSIDDCEKVNVWLSGMLDENDIIERSYNLEVCSAGLDRELIKDPSASGDPNGKKTQTSGNRGRKKLKKDTE